VSNGSERPHVGEKAALVVENNPLASGDTEPKVVSENSSTDQSIHKKEMALGEDSKAPAEEVDKTPELGDALTVLVKQINYCVEEDQFELDFSAHGEIDDLKFYDGMAYVTYCTQEGVLAALKMHDDEYYGRKLSVTIARESGIFEAVVKGLPTSATEDEVKEHFSKCGEVFKIRMNVDKDGKNRGSAFVKFNSKDALDKALALDGKGFQNARIDVSISADNGKGKSRGKGKGKDKGKGKGKSKGKGKGKGKGSK
jgi:RNA recognition motif-containing protein